MIRTPSTLIATCCAMIAACSSGQTETWPGSFDIARETVDFYGTEYAQTEIKILCSQSSNNGLQITITAPDGTQIVATRPTDGAPTSDIAVTGPRGSKTLDDTAEWWQAEGFNGFELNPYADGYDNDVFYMHDGAARCPDNG